MNCSASTAHWEKLSYDKTCLSHCPVCVVFGHEVEGIRPDVSALSDTHVRIPMLGLKHSLNVATAGGIVLYELLRKYRALGEAELR